MKDKVEHKQKKTHGNFLKKISSRPIKFSICILFFSISVLLAIYFFSDCKDAVNSAEIRIGLRGTVQLLEHNIINFMNYPSFIGLLDLIVIALITIIKRLASWAPFILLFAFLSFPLTLWCIMSDWEKGSERKIRKRKGSDQNST